MASWGIMGGAAVDAYQKAEKLRRDSEWQDMQRAAFQRQQEEEEAVRRAIEEGAAEVKGQGIPQQQHALSSPDFIKTTMPGIDEMAATQLAESMKNIKDPEQAKQVMQQYQGHYTKQPQAAGAPAPKAPPPDVRAMRAYKGDDGQMYMSAGEEHAPKQSEIMLAQARKLMQSGGGVKGLQMGMQLQTQAYEAAKLEQQQELQTVLAAPDINGKVSGLLKMLNGSAYVPGTAELVPGPNGTVQLVHNVPGRKEPFSMNITGKSPDEIVQTLAMRVREMTDPKLYYARLEMEALQAHRQQTHDYQMANLKGDQEYRNDMLGLRKQEITRNANESDRDYKLRLAAHNRAQAADKDRANREKWLPYGSDAEGNVVYVDQMTGEQKAVKMPKGVTPFAKVSGEKPDTEGDKAYRRWLTDNGGMDATPAQKLQAAIEVGADPAKFGLKPPPNPAQVLQAIKGQPNAAQAKAPVQNPLAPLTQADVSALQLLNPKATAPATAIPQKPQRIRNGKTYY